MMMNCCSSEKMSNLKDKLQPSFLATWFGTGFLTIFIPLFAFMISRLSNNEEDDNDNNNNDDDGNGNGDENGCSWWQWSCRRNNNNNGDNNQEDDENASPWWWFWSEEERHDDEGANGALIFSYIWSILMFGALLFYGYHSHRNDNVEWHGVVAALVVFANMSFVSLFFLGGLEGGVQVEGREMDEYGFYGQFAAMQFLTSLLWMIFAFSFAIYIRRSQRRASVTRIDIVPSDYQIHPDEVDVKNGVSA